MTQDAVTRALLTVVISSWLGCSSEPTEVERNVDASSQPIRAAVRSNVSVASKLASALRERPGNMFYSPLSIEAVTGLLFAAAAGDTAKQLGVLLDAEEDPAALHEGLGALLRELNQQHPQYTLMIANRLWARPDLESSQAFVDITRDHYNAPVEHADFGRDPEAARDKINDWVQNQTASKIPELLGQGQITPNTVMAVVNAIYFKADWSSAFDKSLTRTEIFHRAGASDVSVKMMTTPKTKLRTAYNNGALWLELPYRTGEVSFLAYTKSGFDMDAKTLSVQELQAELQHVDLDEVVASLREEELIAQMPRFSLRSRLDLIPVFQQLGVTDLFDDRLADLTNLSTGGGVYINPFVHEAAVWIDELGTVAAAATAAVSLLRSGPRTIRLDRPFIFFIRDNHTGAVLFTGHVADPTSDAAD